MPMADKVLRKKKRVCAGHTASATRMVTKVDELVVEVPRSAEGLSQMKPRLLEKLNNLQRRPG